MKKLLLFVVFILSLSSCQRELVVPENYLIINEGLIPVYSDSYYDATLKTVTQLSNNGVKITTENVKFNQASYDSGSLSLTVSNLCNYLNPAMNLNKTYRCDSYSFSNIIVKKCKSN